MIKTLEQMKISPQDNFPQYIIVHNIGGTKLNPLLDTSNNTFKHEQKYHLSLNWENFGYHWFISKNGDITAGRPETYHGAHTKEQEMNFKSIGICLAGNFDATLPTKEQENSLAGLLNAIRGRYPAITFDKIVPHRRFANKTCFGKLLKDDWASNLLISSPNLPIPENKEEIKKQIINLLAKL